MTTDFRNVLSEIGIKKTNREKIRVYLFDVGFACIISNNP